MDIAIINSELEPTVFFLMKNGFSTIILNLEAADDAIMEEIDNSIHNSSIVLIIFVSIGSFMLLVSTLLLIPVVNKIKKNKQDVLELFMNISKTKANNEINRYKKYLGTFQGNPETELIAAEENHEEGENYESNELKHRLKKLSKKDHFSSSKRKYKRLNLNLGLAIFKFVIDRKSGV